MHSKEMGRKSISRKLDLQSSRPNRHTSNGKTSPRHDNRHAAPSLHSNNPPAKPRLHSHNAHNRPTVQSSHRRVKRIARSKVTLNGTSHRRGRYTPRMETLEKEAVPSMAVFLTTTTRPVLAAS